ATPPSHLRNRLSTEPKNFFVGSRNLGKMKMNMETRDIAKTRPVEETTACQRDTSRRRRRKQNSSRERDLFVWSGILPSKYFPPPQVHYGHPKKCHSPSFRVRCSFFCVKKKMTASRGSRGYIFLAA